MNLTDEDHRIAARELLKNLLSQELNPFHTKRQNNEIYQKSRNQQQTTRVRLIESSDGISIEAVVEQEGLMALIPSSLHIFSKQKR
ncbi:hypothetical protein GZ78_13805 [Endozoicomonas numazuensis]|uniref:Uncharacterized protein n=2 Tax=Endozoicomonas numazuensis TaxID=1137799 RepID=A0A081NJB8_9GAMM|nr:hypothetical protein GZ78_13805 [Endozoicomonas numazuensis]